MSGMDELALFEGLRLGSERAFRRLVAAHHAPMLRLAALYVDGAGAQEELIRWTWSTALHGLGMFTWHSTFRAWLFGILVAHGRARPAAAAPTAVPPTALPPPQPAATAPGEGQGVLGAGLAWSSRWSDGGWRALEGALAALPISQREVLHLRDVEGWPATEADAALSVTAKEGAHLLAGGRKAVTSALASWLGLAAPQPARAADTAGAVELLGLLVPAAPADAASAPPPQLAAVFRDWRASRRIPVWHRLRGAHLARTGGRRYAPTASTGKGGA